MGMQVGGSSGGVRSDMNVTPLIDVVLVVLIIFLVTLPMMKKITIEVPKKLQDNEILASTSKQLVVTVKASQQIAFSDGERPEQLIPIADLASTLRPILDEIKTDKVVFVDAEGPVLWAQMVGVMDTIRSLSSDPTNRDQIKVALKIKEPGTPGAPATAP